VHNTVCALLAYALALRDTAPSGRSLVHARNGMADKKGGVVQSLLLLNTSNIGVQIIAPNGNRTRIISLEGAYKPSIRSILLIYVLYFTLFP